ncbi:MAG TPA: VanW family protein [Gaiellaceae bacterium]|nr:VanW family protein [Gaiellaceae bacterium]
MRLEGVTESPYYLRRQRQARVRRIRRISISAAFLLVALVVALAIVYAGSADRIAGGVRIDGVDVAGLSSADAVKKLEQRSQRALRIPVRFVVGGAAFNLRATDIGLKPDWAAAVDAARTSGDGFAPLRGFRRLKLRLAGKEVSAKATFNEAALKAELTKIASRVDQPHREAAVVLQGLHPAIRPARTGQVLDRDAAAGAITTALASLARGNKVQLPLKTDPPRVTAPRLGRALVQARTAVSKPVVLTLGTTRYRLPRWRVATLLDLPRAGATKLRIGGPAADTYFGKLAKVVDSPAKDAQFVVVSGGIRIEPSVDARVLDVPKTSEALLAAVVRPLAERRVAPIAVATKSADRTTQDAKAMGINGIVSSYTTTYGGVPNRIHNVQVVSHLVDNTLIPPGKEFSFNATTGERNAAKGLLEAPVIINGELQNGLGGGTCQVSTTVFNAAYEAGLPITARTNHALYISHYPQGRDATVNYPDTDLKFVNDTGHWLLLRTFVSSNSLSVNLYGTPQHRRVESETAALRTTGAVPVKLIKDPSLEKGTRVVEEGGSPPLATSVTRRVYSEKGKLLYENTWYSSYQGEKQVVLVGTKPKPKPKPADDPSTYLPAELLPAAPPPAA